MTCLLTMKAVKGGFLQPRPELVEQAGFDVEESPKAQSQTSAIVLWYLGEQRVPEPVSAA
jgi:hypothetical protein